MAERRETNPQTDYDAFISYHHETDLPVAVAIQEGLQKFAKPWFRRRSMRVFRDAYSMAANANLWSTVQSAMRQSRFLILIASPESARSPWVAQEVGFWIELGRQDRLLVVVTEGKANWVGSDVDWSSSTALTPALRGAFVGEPLYVDLEWARNAGDIGLRDPRMHTALGRLAAAIEGRPLDELIGDDLREHRRTKRVVRSVVAVLSALVLISAVASVVAVRQRGEAVDQRNIAEQRAMIAVGRQLSAEANVAPSGSLDVAMLMAAQAYAVEPDAPGAAAGMLSTISRSPALVGYLPDSADATAAAVAPAGDVLAIGNEQGQVTLWHAKDRRLLGVLPEPTGRPIKAIGFSRDVRRLAAGDDAGTYSVSRIESGVLDDGDFRTAVVASGQVSGAIRAIALDDDGSDIALGTDSGTIWGPLNAATNRVPTQGSAVLDLAFFDETVVGGYGQGERQVWRRDTGEPVSQENFGFGQPVAAAFSPDFRYFAGVTVGQDPYIATVAAGSMVSIDIGQSGLSIDDMAFDPSSGYLVMSTRAGVAVWDVVNARQVGSQLVGLPGDFVDIDVGAGGRIVIGVGERGVAVWDLDARSPLVREIRPPGATTLSEITRAVRAAAAVLFSSDGRRLAWTMLDQERGLEVVVWDLETDEQIATVTGIWPASFSPDGGRIATNDRGTEDFTVTDLDSGASFVSPTIPWATSGQGARHGPDERTRRDKPWELENGSGIGAAIHSDSTITLWDVSRVQAIGELAVDAEPDAAALAFDPTGHRLAVAATGGVLTLLDTDPESWWERACSMAGRTWTEQERQTLTGDLALPSVCPGS